MIDNNVLLPEPLGPTIARFSPGASVSETPDSTRSGSPGVGYSLTIESTFNSVAVAASVMTVCR